MQDARYCFAIEKLPVQPSVRRNDPDPLPLDR
jgi:hypothetical protein